MRTTFSCCAPVLDDTLVVCAIAGETRRRAAAAATAFLNEVIWHSGMRGDGFTHRPINPGLQITEASTSQSRVSLHRGLTSQTGGDVQTQRVIPRHFPAGPHPSLKPYSGTLPLAP